jgi:hypothetical protein
MSRTKSDLTTQQILAPGRRSPALALARAAPVLSAQRQPEPGTLFRRWFRSNRKSRISRSRAPVGVKNLPGLPKKFLTCPQSMTPACAIGARLPVEPVNGLCLPVRFQYRVTPLASQIYNPPRRRTAFQAAVSHEAQSGRLTLHTPIRLLVVGQFIKRQRSCVSSAATTKFMTGPYKVTLKRRVPRDVPTNHL